MDAEDFENLLGSRGAKAECPSCGVVQPWAIGVDDTDAVLRIAGGGELRALVAICQQCGFIRLHADPTRLDQPRKGSADEGDSPAA